MAELFAQHRLGETRLALWRGGRLDAMGMARDGDGAVAGERWCVQLRRRSGDRGFASAPSGEEILVAPWPAAGTEGALWIVDIKRQAWPEPGRQRLAKAVPVGPGSAPGRIGAPCPRPAIAGQAGPAAAHWPEPVAEAWDQAFEEAELGRVGFNGGTLHFTPTPAFVAVDVDGDGPDLAVAAARELARRIRLWGIGGPVVADLPVHTRDERQRAAAALDHGLAGLSFERTAVNGFGLIEIVLPRIGPSILERARLQPDATDALRLLWQAIAEPHPGAIDLVCRPAVARWLDDRRDLVVEAARRSGRPLHLVAEPRAGAGHLAFPHS